MFFKKISETIILSCTLCKYILFVVVPYLNSRNNILGINYYTCCSFHSFFFFVTVLLNYKVFNFCYFSFLHRIKIMFNFIWDWLRLVLPLSGKERRCQGLTGKYKCTWYQVYTMQKIQVKICTCEGNILTGLMISGILSLRPEVLKCSYEGKVFYVQVQREDVSTKSTRSFGFYVTDGWCWPSSFFCILMDWDNNNGKEKRIETMPMSSGPERTNLINKRFLYCQEKFSFMDVLPLIVFPIVFGHGNVC